MAVGLAIHLRCGLPYCGSESVCKHHDIQGTREREPCIQLPVSVRRLIWLTSVRDTR